MSAKIVVIGAGAMGGSFGALLARGGAQVRLIDGWEEHVAAIERGGLRVDGVFGELRVDLPARTGSDLDDWAGWADWALVFTHASATAGAAETAASVLAPHGRAVTLQNGIGNVETLAQRLGAERVVGGSSLCSAALLAPGHVALTNLDVSTLGEIDGNNGASVAEFAALLTAAGFEVALDRHITTTIWRKFLVNCGINALCAVTGLRSGEMTRVPELYALQDKVLDEALAVTAAKGIALAGDEVKAGIRHTAHYRFNRPSMLQHVIAGRRTEIDAINGALIREARQLGIATPYNEALVALLKGVEIARERAVHEPGLDYAAWEARVADEPLPPG